MTTDTILLIIVIVALAACLVAGNGIDADPGEGGDW